MEVTLYVDRYGYYHYIFGDEINLSNALSKSSSLYVDAENYLKISMKPLKYIPVYLVGQPRTDAKKPEVILCSSLISLNLWTKDTVLKTEMTCEKILIPRGIITSEYLYNKCKSYISLLSPISQRLLYHAFLCQLDLPMDLRFELLDLKNKCYIDFSKVSGRNLHSIYSLFS